ncbi:hypothetical protein GOP47_0008192 [Adiantum capillus-veneris]|uniref:Uncharacterized protein n=1 Tax=Adiantum capillus-veneris TaxID=13818 RepID=A0A9D4UYK1_ADICA|nr:hypothetical protein GOP47_0008192 [Adiantum capillus-veneris]
MSIRNFEHSTSNSQPTTTIETAQTSSHQAPRKQWCSCKEYCYGGRLVAPSTYKRHQDAEARYQEINSVFGIQSIHDSRSQETIVPTSTNELRSDLNCQILEYSTFEAIIDENHDQGFEENELAIFHGYEAPRIVEGGQNLEEHENARTLDNEDLLNKEQ